MFLIGFDMVGGLNAKGDQSVFDANFSTYDFTKVEMEGIVVDELSVDFGTKPFSADKGVWEPSTIFLATFNNTLEAGNLSMNDNDVEKLRFKKRKKGTMDWLLIDEVDYSPEQITYTIRDRLARSNVEYEYAIVPVVADIEGELITNSIVALHEGLWIVDANNSVNILHEVEYGTIQHNTNTNVFELLNSRYPITITGELDYTSGSNSGRLLAYESWLEHKMNYDAELTLRDYVLGFMKNGKPKILKNDKGRYYLIVAKDIQEQPYKLDNGSVSVSFNWVEIGDAEDLETLIACDLLPEQLASIG